MKLFRQFGIIGFTLMIVVSMAGLSIIGCDTPENNSPVTNQTPVASDYEVEGLLGQSAGTVKAVVIKPKTGKSPGAVSNIKYAGVTSVPQTAGTYVVTFDVGAAAGWNGAVGLYAGNLIVNAVPTYGIRLGQGSLIFTAIEGYTALPESKPVDVMNPAGNLATGQLNLALSGPDADKFTLSAASLASIDAGGNASFTVQPKASLPLGVYNATVTVSNTNITSSNTVSVRFEVITNATPIYSINIDKASLTFTGTAGTQPAAQTVTVTNTGNQATGQLNLALSAGASNFTLSPASSLASIAVGGSATFTVRPNATLVAGIYNATITVSNANITANNTVAVSCNLAAAPVIRYGISLDKSSLSFTGPAGTQPAAQSVKVSNPAGNEATGQLNLAFTVGGENFTLSASSLDSISAGGERSFTVQPKPGLAANTYIAIVTVSNNNIPASGANTISMTYTISTNSIFGISLDKTLLTFNGAAGTQPAAQSVTVSNAGNTGTGQLNLAFSSGGTNFILSASSLDSIAAGSNRSFTVQPRSGLAPNTYSATVSVSGSSIPAGTTVSIVCTISPYGFSVDQTSLSFTGSAVEWPDPQTVKVTSIGSMPVGPIEIMFATGGDNFVLSTSTLPIIAVGSNSSFTVVPKSGLSTGTYSASLNVRYASVLTTAIPVSANIRAAQRGFTLSTGTTSSSTLSSHTFPETQKDNDVPAALFVNVINIAGNYPTGNLTITMSGTDTSSFILSTGTMVSVVGGSMGTFSVVPKAGLAVKNHSATVYVAGTGTNPPIATQNFTVDFSVVDALRTPVLSDYKITGNMTQSVGSIANLTITRKTVEEGGRGAPAPSNVWYNGNLTSIPNTAGVYAVTFDVPAVSGWIEQKGLSAGTVTVLAGQGVIKDKIEIIWKDGEKEVTISPVSATISTSNGTQKVEVSGTGVNAAAIKGWYLNGSYLGSAYDGQTSYTFTRTELTRTGTHTVSVIIEIDSKLYKADSVIEVE